MLTLKLFCAAISSLLLPGSGAAALRQLHLERVTIMDQGSYRIEQETEGERVFAVLVDITAGERVRLVDADILLYSGRGGGRVDPTAKLWTLPWSMFERKLFVGVHGRGAHTPGMTSWIWRFPIGVQSREKGASYCVIEPVSRAWQRMVMDPSGNQRLLPEFPGEVFYDLRTVDEERLELFMTVDGQLSKWVFDGKSWNYDRSYNLQVFGPFLILDTGNSMVAQCNDAWSVIRYFEKQHAQCEPLTDGVNGAPLTLVEDKVARTNYFLHRDRLLDDKGRSLATLRRSDNETDRVRQAIDAVVARRAQP